jgi:hypothetical protein
MVACDNEDVSIGFQFGTPAGTITVLSEIMKCIPDVPSGIFGISFHY